MRTSQSLAGGAESKLNALSGALSFVSGRPVTVVSVSNPFPTTEIHDMHSAIRTALTATGGVVLTVGLITGAGAVAAAQGDDPELGATTAPAEIESDATTRVEIIELDDADLDETELDEMILAEGEYDEEAWLAYDECFDAALADTGVDLDALDTALENGEDPSDAEFEAMEAAFETADATCEEFLPEDVKAEMAEWAAFDECIEGIEDPFADGSILWIPAEDGDIAVEFGAETGTVTIGGTAEAIEIVDAEGVEVLGEAELDAMFAEADEAWSACDELAPEGAFELYDDELEELPMD